MERSPVGDTERQEDNGVKNLEPKFYSLPQLILVNPLENCSKDNDDHAAANEGETTDEPNIHESKN